MTVQETTCNTFLLSHLLMYSQLTEGIFYTTVTSRKQHPFGVAEYTSSIYMRSTTVKMLQLCIQNGLHHIEVLVRYLASCLCEQISEGTVAVIA